MSQPQIIGFPKYAKTFSPAELSQPKIINIRELFKNIFCLQKCLSRKSSLSRKYPKTSSPAELSQQQIIGFPNYSKTFSPAELSQPKIINIRELFKNFFCLQTCRSRKSPIFRKYSKAFSPAEQHQEQVIKIPELFKDFFACRIVLAANRQYPENTQSLFRLQNCLSCKSSISRKYPMTSSPAELSQQQIINTPEIFKDFFACRIVSAANHQYPEKTQRLIGLQNCLSRKSSVSRKDSKTFSPAELSHQQIINIPEIFKDFLPAEMSQPQIIDIPEISKDFFACRVVLAANHQYPGNIQRLFCLQNCPSRKSSVSRKNPKTFSLAELSQPQIIYTPEIFKDFFACRIVLAANHRFPEIFKDFFACRVVLAENHQYPGIIQKLFLPVDLSQPQITNIPEIFKGFFACRIALGASHQNPGII